jgi:Flp pilus assembly protein CpaB
MNRRWSLIGAAACGLLAFFLVWRAESGLQGVQVVVARRTVSAGEEVRAGDVELRVLPRRAVLGDAYRRKEEVVGKVARAEIFQGEQIIRRRIEGDGLPASEQLRPGERAVYVSLGTEHPANLFRLGDRVEVVVGSEEGPRTLGPFRVLFLDFAGLRDRGGVTGVVLAGPLEEAALLARAAAGQRVLVLVRSRGGEGS